MLKIGTRKTKQGYFQPVLTVIETGQRYTPGDMNCHCLDRKTALKQAQQWKNESIEVGYIVNLGG